MHLKAAFKRDPIPSLDDEDVVARTACTDGTYLASLATIVIDRRIISLEASTVTATLAAELKIRILRFPAADASGLARSILIVSIDARRAGSVSTGVGCSNRTDTCAVVARAASGL